jgi:hypothetical protein
MDQKSDWQRDVDYAVEALLKITMLRPGKSVEVTLPTETDLWKIVCASLGISGIDFQYLEDDRWLISRQCNGSDHEGQVASSVESAMCLLVSLKPGQQIVLLVPDQVRQQLVESLHNTKWQMDNTGYALFVTYGNPIEVPDCRVYPTNVRKRWYERQGGNDVQRETSVT